MRSSATSGQSLIVELPNALGSIALLGIVIYVVLDVILGFLPPHYSPIHQPESDYGVGPYGYLMGINFVVRGLFSLALVGALWSRRRLTSTTARLGAGLLAVWAIASMLLAAFPTDVEGAPATAHGKLHVLLAFIAFLAALTGELVLTSSLRQDARWQRLMRLPRILAWLAIPAFVWCGVALARHTASSGTAGLAERAFLALIIAWMGAVAIGLREQIGAKHA